jgi:ATP-binding cassette subfamily B protein/subfamily B ATP-binding cassette protein MsbA
MGRFHSLPRDEPAMKLLRSSLLRYRASVREIRDRATKDAHGIPAASEGMDRGAAGGAPLQLATLPALPSAVERRRYLAAYRVWLRPHFRLLALVVLLALGGIAIDMLWPLVSRYLIDQVVLSSELDVATKIRTIALSCAGMILLFSLNSLLNLTRSFRMVLLTSKLSFDLRSRIFHRVLRLPMAELSDLKTGGILSRLSSDVDNTTGLLHQALMGPALAAVRLSATIAIIFTLDWRIATAVMLAVPPIVIVQNFWVRRVRPIWKSIGQDRADIDGRVNEALSGIRVVRGFRRERREQLAYSIGHHTVIRKQMLATRTQRLVALIWDFIIPTTQVFVIGYGGYLVVKGQTTLGTLVAFQGYIWRLLDPIMQIVNSIAETQRGLAALERVFDLLDRPPEKPDRPGALDAPPLVESIAFEEVTFEYRPGTPVLHDFSLLVRGGTVTALVGPSGAGKTTVTDLVARFNDPTKGRILLNGVDVRELKLRGYRSLLGIVAQEVFLFDGTVRENIAYGRPRATEEEVLDAARRANAHEFIERLPEGYDTLIGERGVKLSGGQRQRLSIARAILANPQILILDEATSNLDTESEQLIQASIGELLRDRTTFVIAHRLSTIANADRIVVLDAGRIVESGTHDELMAKQSTYHAMVELQRERALTGGDLGTAPGLSGASLPAPAQVA